jgi:hypothetical protein
MCLPTYCEVQSLSYRRMLYITLIADTNLVNTRSLHDIEVTVNSQRLLSCGFALWLKVNLMVGSFPFRQFYYDIKNHCHTIAEYTLGRYQLIRSLYITVDIPSVVLY